MIHSEPREGSKPSLPARNPIDSLRTRKAASAAARLLKTTPSWQTVITE